MTEATFVFRHSDEKEARRFCKELFDQYPFCGGGPTHVIACSTGDAMSVADAVRMALLCTAIDHDERREFALAMCECNNWEDCLKLAEEWELRHDCGEFVDTRSAASVDGSPQGQDPAEGLGRNDDSAVAKPDAQTPPNPSTYGGPQ